MNQRQLASVLFGVGGTFLVVSRLPDIVIQLTMLTQWDPTVADEASPINQRALVIIGLSGTLLAMLLGLGLILLRDTLASRLFQVSTQSLNGPEIQAVAFSVLGCYFAVHGVARVYQPGRLDWVAAAELVIGAGLFLGSRELARLWGRPHSGDGALGANGGGV